MSKRVRFLCACLCAALAVFACMGYVNGVRAEANEARRQALEEAGHDAVPVVVAKRELAAGARVTRADVEQTDWIGDYVPEGALASVEECLDARLTSAVPAGAVLCSVDFRASGEAQSVPSGYVAINLQLSRNLGVPSTCEPGTSVVAYTVGSGSGGEVNLAAADARVLSVTASDSSLSPDTITLAVLPQDVAAVVAATRNDSLRLVLPAEDVSAIPDPVALAHTGGSGTEMGPKEVAPVEAQGASDGAYGEAAGDEASSEGEWWIDE